MNRHRWLPAVAFFAEDPQALTAGERRRMRRRARIQGALAMLALAALAWAIVADHRDLTDQRRACTAQGGILVAVDDAPLCLWAGAVIPVPP